MALSDSWAHLKNRRLAVMLPLGFASGLPLALTAGTLQAWLTVVDVDLRTIGLFTLVGLPYTLKFLWAPVMDRFVPPWLGHRRDVAHRSDKDTAALSIARRTRRHDIRVPRYRLRCVSNRCVESARTW